MIPPPLLPPLEPERAVRRDVLSPVSDLIHPHNSFHYQQRAKESILVTPPVPANKDLVVHQPPRRRRASSPMGGSDDRPRKRKRSSNPTENAESTAKIEDEHSRVPEMIPHRPASLEPLCQVHIELQGDSGSGGYSADPVEAPVKKHPGSGSGRLNISDMLNAETTQEASDRHAGVDSGGHLIPQPNAEVPEVLQGPAEPMERSPTKELHVQDVVVKKQSQQDPHEWLLEHYGGSPPPPQGSGAPSSTPAEQSTRTSPPTRASSTQTRSPEALATVDQELEEVAGMVLSPTKAETDADANSDVDIVTEFVAETLDGADSHPAPVMDVDVENELLSLVDDRPAVPHLLRHLPQAPSPLSQQRRPPPQRPPSTSPDKQGLSGQHSRRASPAVSAIIAPSPLRLSPVVPVVCPSGSPSISTPTVERGSMPPPASTSASGTVPPKKGESAPGPKKKKEGSSKVGFPFHLMSGVVFSYRPFDRPLQSLNSRLSHELNLRRRPGLR